MRECVTHHYTCDCREEKFKEMENQLKEALSIIEESLPIMRGKYIRNQWFERIEKLKRKCDRN